jgi:hypothetical protein
MVAVVILIGGLLYGLLDPAFDLSARGLVTYAGIVLGLVAVTWIAALPHRALHEVLFGDRGRLWGPPLALVIAALCVLISRLVGFLPGYLYGLLLGFTFAWPLEGRENARAWSAASWWLLALAFVAWLVLGAARTPGLEDSVPAAIVQSVMAAIGVAGIEAIVFDLVPIRFLPGEHLFRFRRLHWAMLYAVGVFAFAWIILDPANGFLVPENRVSLFAAVGLFVAFGLASVLFWAWFRFRRPPAGAAESPA